MLKLNRKNKGNALFYVLLGVVLLAALSYNIIRQDTGTGAAQQLSDEKAAIYAAQLINHAAAVKGAIDQMLATGSTIDDIDFVLPEEASYDTPPHQHKVFHPGGGGISPMIEKAELFNGLGVDRGWSYMINTNVAWTPTSQSDIIYSFMDTSKQICEKINQKLIGNTSIPAILSSVSGTFEYGGTDNNFTTTTCATCEGISSYCVSNNAQTIWVFYTIVAAR